MAQLPQEQKAKIAEQVASFQEEKSKLDAEVSKWDDSGNDIIVLAKQMCMIMMEMTDFTRWGYLLPAPFVCIAIHGNPQPTLNLKVLHFYSAILILVALSSVVELICMYMLSYLNLNIVIVQANYLQVRGHV